MNKITVMIGLLIGVGGIIFSLLPPDMHMAIFGGNADIENMDMDEGMNAMQNENMSHDHGKFVTYGMVAAVIGFALAFAGWKIFD